MEFQNLSPPSKVDREYRELEKRVQEELCAFFGISMKDYVRVVLEEADERLRATKRRRGVLSQAWAWLSTRSRCHGKG